MKTNRFSHRAFLSTALPRLTPLLGALSLVACDPEFDPTSEVNSIRVLAVQADTPFAAPGETVHLQALSHDPSDRPITWAWASCDEPASSSIEACLANIVETTIETGAPPLLGMGAGLSQIDLPIAPDAIERLPPAARPQALVGVLSVACPGDLELAENGTSPLLPFRCTEAGTDRELDLHDSIIGIKRVFLRETERNQNPVIESVLFDGEAWAEDDVKEVDGCTSEEHVYDDCPGAVRHRIQAVLTPDSFEAGSDEFGRGFDEEVIVQHYTESGIVEDEVRIGEESETGWVARASASGSELSVWFIARDDRGGVAWAERRVRVR